MAKRYNYTAYMIDKESGQYTPVSTTTTPTGLVYSDFVDAPIKNAHGSTLFSYVDVPTLDYGTYNVSGYYKLQADLACENTGNDHINMFVTKDTVTGEKVVAYSLSADNVYYTHIISYEGTTIANHFIYDMTSTLNRIATNETNISTLQGKVDVLEADENTEGSVRNTVTRAVLDLIAGADASLDTLKEIADWITNHADDAVDMNNRLVALKTLVGEELPQSAQSTTVIDYAKELVDNLDSTATIAVQNGNVVRIKSGLIQTDGIVSNDANEDIVLQSVAITGQASDVSVADSGDKLEATNVEDAISEVVGMVENTHRMAEIFMEHQEGSLTYSIFQGTRDNNTKIGDVIIPPDKVITSGELYVATNSDTGLTSGRMYIIMNVENGEPFYVDVNDLIDIYTGTNVSTGIRINVNNGVVSATIMTLDGTKLDDKSVAKAKLSDQVQASLNLADSAVQTIIEGDGNGQIKVDGTNINVHGLGSSAYTDISAFDPSGSASTAKAEVMGNASTDTAESKTIEGLIKKTDATNRIIGTLDTTTYENVLDYADKKAQGAKNAGEIILVHQNGTLVYQLFQGAQDNDHFIGEIDIPSDMVVTSGSLYTATSWDTDLVEGDLYIKMMVANGNPFYIPVQELIDVYVGSGDLSEQVTSGIKVNVRNGIISATAVTLDGTKLDPESVSKASLSSGVQTTLGLAETAVQAITEGSANGTVSVDGTNVRVHGLGSAAYSNSYEFDNAGSADTVRSALMGSSTTDTTSTKTIEGLVKKTDAINTKIGYLDTTTYSDVMDYVDKKTASAMDIDSQATIASVLNSNVILKKGITQTNGAIDNSTDSDITLSAVALTGAATSVSISDANQLFSAKNVETALQELGTKINQYLQVLTWHDLD